VAAIKGGFADLIEFGFLNKPMSMITGINHITVAVINIEKSFSFYKDVLGFKPLCKWHEGAYLTVGDLWFCLSVDEKREPGLCYTHYAFSVPAEAFGAMSRKIAESGAPIFKENTSPGESLYFLDPDGHKLEIHVGDWQSRIATKKAQMGEWQDVEWFV
jgi:catechol 2,3-dioxygenase-like lactoylglutathione lyase family enzyme